MHGPPPYIRETPTIHLKSGVITEPLTKVTY